MTQEEYNKLSTDLQSLAKKIPLNWLGIQNDKTDRNINMFEIQSYDELERQIINLNDNSKIYFRRRWFLWRCSQCDEHLFCLNDNVSPNPNPRDQSYDIEFNNEHSTRFDIKGTVIPREFRNDIPSVLANPQSLINFYYEQQSTGVRYKIQNRLFIIHHSFKEAAREMYLRCHWKFKTEVYKEYSSLIKISSNFIHFKEATADLIFIFENLDGTITKKFIAV